jgi:hypothetical protein
MPAEDPSVPQWAADLRVSVAKIEGRTEQIPEISRAIEELRASTVPMHEHLKLLNDVEVLKDRDLGQRGEWEDMVERVPILWDERTRRAGERRGYRVILTSLGVMVTLLTAIELLSRLGVSVSVHP